MLAPGQIQELKTYGRTRLPLPPTGVEALELLRTEAARFFMQDEDVKCRHGSVDFNFGYRPYGRQYSVTPDRPDMNSSFTYWAGDPTTVPGNDQPSVAGFVAALAGYWKIAAEVAGQLLTTLAEHHGYSTPFAFRPSSYLEVNWYFADVQRDLLQDRHEDGHLFTLAISDGPGLEVEHNGVMRAPGRAADELLVMAGSVLTAMTDGQIPPLYHQVRNHHLAQRITVLMLINPPLNGPAPSYVPTSGAVDVASLARNSGAMFGLPPAPLLAPAAGTDPSVDARRLTS